MNLHFKKDGSSNIDSVWRLWEESFNPNVNLDIEIIDVTIEKRISSRVIMLYFDLVIKINNKETYREYLKIDHNEFWWEWRPNTPLGEYTGFDISNKCFVFDCNWGLEYIKDIWAIPTLKKLVLTEECWYRTKPFIFVPHLKDKLEITYDKECFDSFSQ